MTREQGTAAISIGIATTIMAIVVIIVSTVNRDYMREYVQKSIEIYDSTVTKTNQAQFDTIIHGLNEIKTQLP